MRRRRRTRSTPSVFLTSHKTGGSYRRSPRERLIELVELVLGAFAPLVVLAVLLAVALIVQALWSPLAGGLAALGLVALLASWYWWLPHP
jgi:hypothetical protein